MIKCFLKAKYSSRIIPENLKILHFESNLIPRRSLIFTFFVHKLSFSAVH